MLTNRATKMKGLKEIKEVVIQKFGILVILFDSMNRLLPDCFFCSFSLLIVSGPPWVGVQLYLLKLLTKKRNLLIKIY